MACDEREIEYCLENSWGKEIMTLNCEKKLHGCKLIELMSKGGVTMFTGMF